MKDQKPDTSKLTILKTYLGIFDYSVYTVISRDRGAVVEWARWAMDAPGEWPGWEHKPLLGTVFRKDGQCPVIWIPRPPKDYNEIATLAHEAVHAMMMLADWINIEVTHDTEELVAHGVSSVVRDVMDQLKEKQKEQKASKAKKHVKSAKKKSNK